MELIDKKEGVKVDNLGESGDELEEYEAVGDSNDKLANGVEGEGDARGSDICVPNKDGSGERLVVRTRGELESGIDETVVGSRLAGMGGGGISFVSEDGHISWNSVLDYIGHDEPEDTRSTSI